MKMVRRITTEPLMALYLATYVVTGTLRTQYVVYAINLKYNVSQTGDSGGGPCASEETMGSSTTNGAAEKAQTEAVLIQTVYNITQAIPSLFLSLFLGSYSDLRGRRIAIILPIIGVILQTIVFIIQAAFPSTPVELTILGTLLDGLSGSSTAFRAAVYAYISDISEMDKSDKSFRILVNEIAYMVLFAGLQLANGYIITGLGYLWSFIIFLGFFIIALVYVLFFLPESRVSSARETINPITMIVVSFKSVMRNRSMPQPRSMLLLFMLAYCFLLIHNSYHTIETMFLIDSPICMDPVLLGYFKMAKCGIPAIASIIIMKLILPKTGDFTVLVISCISTIAYFITFALSTTIWLSFVALMVGFSDKVLLPIGRAILSKLVTEDEQGGLMSVLFVLEEINKSAGSALFNYIYAATLTFFKGTTFICYAVATSIGLVIACIYICLVKRRRSISTEDTEADKMDEGSPLLTSQNERI